MAAHSFLELVAAADPAACDRMTESGAEFVEAASGEDSCEEAIEAQTYYLNDAFFSAEPGGLTARLEEGLLDTSGTEAELRLCTANETHVTLDLVKASDGWRVDLVTVGQKVVVDAADEKSVQPCVVNFKRAQQ